MRKRRLCNYVASSLGVIRFGPVLLQREQYMYTYMHHCNNASFCCTNMQIRSAAGIFTAGCSLAWVGPCHAPVVPGVGTLVVGSINLAATGTDRNARQRSWPVCVCPGSSKFGMVLTVQCSHSIPNQVNHAG